MKLKVSGKKCILTCFLIASLIVVFYVLFKYPHPGVADQGDFDRVMGPAGLQLTDTDKADPNFQRFFDYTVSTYKISDNLSILSTLANSSITIFITIISFICRIFNESIFKTDHLALLYSAVYIFSFFIIFKYLKIQSKTVMFCLMLLSIFVLFDGNYLIWFNSLYGEPMMIVSLMLYISAYIYYLDSKNETASHKNIILKIILIFAAAYLFLGSKLQVITALPIIDFMLIRLLYDNKKVLKNSHVTVFVILLVLINIYPIRISMLYGSATKDTQFNSVFYGILKGSENPRQDLIDLGLNPDMAVEAGKHSYLLEKDYVKYIPHTKLTEEEFYSKISNGKLAKFYITHPLRFIKGMEYTASRAFFTGSPFGKFERSYSEVPIKEFNRFTLWSDLRNRIIPKSLLFIVLFYGLVLSVSIGTFVKRSLRPEIKERIILFWSVVIIGMVQFPMPYVGNGEADTKKQLFLFNFIFDMILVVSICFAVNYIIKLIRIKSEQLKTKAKVW